MAPARPGLMALLASVLLIASASGAVATGYRQRFTIIDDSAGGKSLLFSRDGTTVTGANKAGDTFVWRSNALQPSDNKKVGTNYGACVYAAPSIGICTWTLTLKRGSITVSGSLDERPQVIEIAIVGGTGAYAGATGYVRSAIEGNGKFRETFYLF